VIERKEYLHGLISEKNEPAEGEAVTNEAFVNAIRQAPDDDGLRLVYSDWLEENGDESDQARAEFIRAQVELERLPMDAPGRPELEDCADDLRTAFEERWLSPVPAHLGEWTWRRGYLDNVHFAGPGSVDDVVRFSSMHPLTETNWRASAEELLRILDMPEVAALRFLHLNPTRDPAAFVEGLTGRPEISNLTGLTLMGRPAQEGLAEVASLASTGSLTSLVLMEFLSSGMLTGILAGGAWPRLDYLHAHWHGAASSAQMRPLFTPPRSQRWRDLGLGPLTPAAASGLVELSALRRLELSWRVDAAVPRFAFPPGLADLDFSVTGDAGSLFAALAETDGIEQLRRLRIRFWSGVLQGEDWQALGRLLGRLRGPVLHLEAGYSYEGFLAGLVELPHLDRVVGLTWSPRIPLPGELEGFLKCPQFTGLRELDLRSGRIEKATLRLLPESPWIERLRKLHLRGVDLGYRELKCLLESPRLQSLTSLNINYARMGIKALKILGEWPGLPRLRHLTIGVARSRGSADRLPLRLEALSPLAVLYAQSAGREEDRQRLRARHGRRMWS
jgi:uncharacterized protein (TIGR02996 family)